MAEQSKDVLTNRGFGRLGGGIEEGGGVLGRRVIVRAIGYGCRGGSLVGFDPIDKGFNLG